MTVSESRSFLAACKARRTHYDLTNRSPVSDDKITDIVEAALLHTPSSFNSQGTRVVILLHQEHRYLWNDIVKPAVKEVAPDAQWTSTEAKLNSFRDAYGTVSLQGFTPMLEHADDELADWKLRYYFMKMKRP